LPAQEKADGGDKSSRPQFLFAFLLPNQYAAEQRTANRRADRISGIHLRRNAMTPVSLLVFLAVGALAGWLAGKLMKGSGFGLIGNIVVGIVGAFIGNWIFGVTGIHVARGLANYLITSVVGASVLLFVVGLFKK
jgi:uncharacterized membrane protein YeaQ/YmgE (transglycosylase-associated protein family)